jgi:hypothetical protein
LTTVVVEVVDLRVPSALLQSLAVLAFEEISHSVWFRFCCRVATPDHRTSRRVRKCFLLERCILFPSPEKERSDEKRLAQGLGCGILNP